MMKRIFLNNNKIPFILTMALSVIEAGLCVGTAFIIKETIDIATSHSLEGVEPFVLRMALFFIGYIVIGILSYKVKNDFIERGMCNYKNECFFSFFKSKERIAQSDTTGKYVSFFTNNMESIQSNYLESVMSVYSNITLAILGLFAMFYLSITMTICVIIISLIPLVGSFVMGNFVAEAEEQVSIKNKSYTECVQDILVGFSVIKAFNAASEVLILLRNTVFHLESAKEKKRNKQDLTILVNGALSLMSFLVIFLVGALFTLRGWVTIGAVMAFVQLLNYVLGPIQSVSNSLAKIAAGKKLMKLFEEEISEEDSKCAVEKDDIQKIIISNSSVMYGDISILQGIDLLLQKGKSYAIVGRSGSGKTTLLNLIAGSIESTGGNILVDQTEMEEIDEECRSKLFSIIQQNVMIFNSSIRDNITMWKKCFSNQQIEEAVRGACLNQLVEEKTLEYECGENGCNLSGGERQRISIARAILQKSAVILVDEGTSALDKKSSSSVEKTILNMHDKIIVVVTHDLNENHLKQYDEIIVLKNGTIEEQGTYDELSSKAGYFWALSNL